MSKLKRFALEVKEKQENYQDTKRCFGKTSFEAYKVLESLQQSISNLLNYIYKM